MMRLAGIVGLTAILAVAAPIAQSSGRLTIYVIDTEGGKATLFVAPTGRTVLIDTGNPGTRDADRVMAAIRDAGVTRIDYLILSHYHADHVGGLEALATRIPIGTFVDHGPTVEEREQLPGFAASYPQIRGSAAHTVVKAGSILPLSGLDWRIVSAAGHTITAPLVGGGTPNRSCAEFKRQPEDPGDENNQSIGSVIAYGQFRAIDLADLVPNREGDLMCPRNLIGTVDLYLVSHHGTEWSGTPALVHGLNPRVAVMQNGAQKGGTPATEKILRSTPGLEDIWQTHWAYPSGIEYNPAGVYIANMDDAQTVARVLTGGASAGGDGTPDHQPAYWIKISAQANGDFTVTNSRNGFSKTYAKR